MKLNHSDYKHLSFDLWLTLIKSNPEFKSKRNVLFKSYFDMKHPMAKVTEVVRYYDVLCNNINEKTGRNLDTFEIYLFILTALDVKPELLSIQNLSAFYLETETLFMQYKPVLMYPETGLLFESIIAADKTISILSNTGFIKGHTLRKLMLHYGLDQYISFQVYSDEAGYSKPDNRVFELVYEQVCNINKIQKHEVLHIGDNRIADFDGATQYGFGAQLINI